MTSDGASSPRLNTTDTGFFFSRGRPPTKNELALGLVRRIMADIDADRREWEFSALSPEDQQAERARAEQEQKEWKRRIAELKRKRSIIEASTGMDEG